MLDFKSVMSGAPIPPVDAGDMKRVWELTSEATRGGSAAAGSVGWDVRVVARQCSAGSDPLAVFFRGALLGPLLTSGLLDEWREGDRFHEVVFQTMAVFPLPNGVQGFRPEEFVEALRRQRSP